MLHYRVIGEGAPLVIVHGLFGSGDNWTTLAGKIPGYQVFLPDLRNHGDSPWYPTFSLAELADDLADLHQELGLGPCPWIGHSLGGKAVMKLALSHPDKVSGIAVLDMSPRETEARYPHFLRALSALNLEGLAGRSQALVQLEPAISDRPTLQFLLKSLVPGTVAGTWRWKLNLKSLEENYFEIWKAVDGERTWDGPTLFLSGGNSDFFPREDQALALVRFPRATFDSIPGAGHWLHAEKPREVLTSLLLWLKDLR